GLLIGLDITVKKQLCYYSVYTQLFTQFVGFLNIVFWLNHPSFLHIVAVVLTRKYTFCKRVYLMGTPARNKRDWGLWCYNGIKNVIFLLVLFETDILVKNTNVVFNFFAMSIVRES